MGKPKYDFVLCDVGGGGKSKYDFVLCNVRGGGQIWFYLIHGVDNGCR